MENQTTPPANGNNSKNLLIILIVLLLCSNGVMGYLYFTSTKTVENQGVQIEDLSAERTQLTGELNDMITQYDDMKSTNDEMNAELEEQQEKIQELLAEAKKHKDDAYIMYKLRKETSTLREIMKGYLVTIDSLNTLNVNLQAEKVELGQKLDTEKDKVNDLEKDKSELAGQVAIGAQLRALGTSAIAQRVKRNKVHRETNKASRTDKIKTCFTIDRNKLAKGGKKDIHMRIIGPDGLVLKNDASGTFDVDGKQEEFSSVKEILYENESLDICMYFEFKGDASSGNYVIEVYNDGNEIGKALLMLK